MHGLNRSQSLRRLGYGISIEINCTQLYLSNKSLQFSASHLSSQILWKDFNSNMSTPCIACQFIPPEYFLMSLLVEFFYVNFFSLNSLFLYPSTRKPQKKRVLKRIQKGVIKTEKIVLQLLSVLLYFISFHFRFVL